MPTCSLWTSLAGVDSTSDVVTCSWVVNGDVLSVLGDDPYVPALGDTPCVKRLARVNLVSLQQKIAPFSIEDGAIRLLGLCGQSYAKRATSSCRTSVILTSELTGTNSLTPW